jgi:hypothetical protein
VTDSVICVVCREDADERTTSVCHSCGERYHLNERNDNEGKDCGQVWIDEQFLALRFGCQRCLGQEDAAPEPSRVRRPRTAKRRYVRRDSS